MIITKESVSQYKAEEIEMQILIHVTEFHEQYHILSDEEEEDFDLEVGYFLIENKTIQVNLNFYIDVKNTSVWLRSKKILIEDTSLIERIEILTSYF